MTTHERELVDPVDLCTPDGLQLNRAALGWSRRPLHRANLVSRFGENKRWDYWAVLAGDLIISSTVADLDHLGLADVYWVDLVTGATGGHAIVVGAGEGVSLPERAGLWPIEVDQGSFDLLFSDDASGTHLSARWLESDGRPGHLDVFVALPDGHESLNVGRARPRRVKIPRLDGHLTLVIWPGRECPAWDVHRSTAESFGTMRLPWS